MKKWPVIGFIGRVLVWGVAGLVSVLAMIAVTFILAAIFFITIRPNASYFGLALSFLGVGIIWPACLSASLIFLDCALFEGPSKRLLKFALGCSLAPFGVYLLAWIAGFGTTALAGAMRFDDVAAAALFGLYLSPSIATAFFGCRYRNRRWRGGGV